MGGRLEEEAPRRLICLRRRLRKRHQDDGHRGAAGFGKKLVAPFDLETSPTETIYLVSRTEQARDRRIAALRRWIVDAVDRAL
jgi:DNA-binding transcriptional LysR family regulator